MSVCFGGVVVGNLATLARDEARLRTALRRVLTQCLPPRASVTGDLCEYRKMSGPHRPLSEMNPRDKLRFVWATMQAVGKKGWITGMYDAGLREASLPKGFVQAAAHV